MDKNITNQHYYAPVQQHSITQSIILHLLPGALIVILYIGTAPIAIRWGYPPYFAMLLVALFILTTFELGHLIHQGKKKNGRWSLHGIVLYREHMPITLYAYLVPLLTILAFIILILTSPLDTILIDMLSWLPKWFVMADTIQYVHYSRSSLIITFTLALILNGIVFPIIEEMYFRGYLMPRISRFGLWTPVIGHFLFTIYHFWQPYNYPTVFLGVLPLTMAVWWKRNIRLGIITHCLLNIIGGLLTIGLVFGQID